MTELQDIHLVLFVVAVLCFVATLWSLLDSLIRDSLNDRIYYALLSVIMFVGLACLVFGRFTDESLVLYGLATFSFGATFFSLLVSLIKDSQNGRIYYAAFSIITFVGLVCLVAAFYLQFLAQEDPEKIILKKLQRQEMQRNER